MSCRKWAERKNDTEAIFDIYDSVGVIYAVICNLSRTERYKSHNILTLAVIPGLKELKLHEINNYLYPIISQLVHLWSGYNIVIHENKSGHFV